jgi:hypothetical protein
VIPSDEEIAARMAALRRQVHRFTCRRCGQTFACANSTSTAHSISTDSSWNRYALHTYECRGRGPVGYDHDVIDTGPFHAVREVAWSPYA